MKSPASDAAVAVVFQPRPVKCSLGENCWLPLLAAVVSVRIRPSALVLAAGAAVMGSTPDSFPVAAVIVPVRVGEAASTTEPVPVKPVLHTIAVVPLAVQKSVLVRPLKLGVAAAHVPSPRQKVLEDAPVPLLRSVTPTAPVKVVAVTVPTSCNAVDGDVVPIPTLPPACNVSRSV